MKIYDLSKRGKRIVPMSSGVDIRARTHQPQRAVLFLALMLALPAARAQTTVQLAPYNPQNNDNLQGATVVSNGAQVTLSGPQQFITGARGTASVSLNTLAAEGRIVSGANYIGAARLELGPLNYGVSVPDPITGGQRVISTYATANLVDLPRINGTATVSDIVNANGNQYINTRIGSVAASGGVFNVAIGQAGAAPAAISNSWTMAAKQSALFDADGSGAQNSTINWRSNNRISFNAVEADPTQAQGWNISSLATYGGSFQVTTRDGVTQTQTVNNAAQLRTYNDWLIAQLGSGNLDMAQYTNEFNKAVQSQTRTLTYNVAASSSDEVALAVGDRNVIRVNGARATANIVRGAQLQVANSVGGATRAENGASLNNAGTLSNIADNPGGSAAMYLVSGSHGSNDGVINGGLLYNADGSVLSSYYASDTVYLRDTSDFANRGVINVAGGTASALPSGLATGIRLDDASNASNSGTINVGVTGTEPSGSQAGVLMNGNDARFDNAASGLIYLGRAAQASVGAAAADVALNQPSRISGIAVTGAGAVDNAGRIVIGTLTQNAAGMMVNGVANAQVRNSGSIDINGRANAAPLENVGMLVLNAGATGSIVNDGQIHVDGINNTGIKVLSTGSSDAVASSNGSIDVIGTADPASGTRNFGLWAEGQGSGQARAEINGTVNLFGDGAIGIHARGNALVTLEPTGSLHFADGSQQIGLFAYGSNASIRGVSGGLDVSTARSTLFRLESGAAFDGSGMSLTASGAQSVGVLGSGAGTRLETYDASMQLSGTGATGVLAEGGASAQLDAASRIDLSGAGTVAAIADGQKHDVNGVASGTPDGETRVDSAASLSSISDGVTGYIARHGAQLNQTGNIDFSGAGTTGLRVESGATGQNSGNIRINDGGIGLLAVSASGDPLTTANSSGSFQVDGGSLTTRSRGAEASGEQAVVNLQDGAQLRLGGVGAIGAQADQGGIVNIGQSATPQFGNDDQIAFRAAGSGSRIVSAATALDASGRRATLYRIDDGASLMLDGRSTLAASGNGARAILATGASTRVDGIDEAINVSGQNAVGVDLRGGAQAQLDAASRLTLSGENATGVLLDGQNIDLAGQPLGSPSTTTLLQQGQINGAGAGAIGALIRNGGTLEQAGAITLRGAGTRGVWVQDGGSLLNSGNIEVSDGTGVRLDGGGAVLGGQGGSIRADGGVAAVALGNGARLSLNGAQTLSAAGGADGVLLDAGAGALDASGGTIHVDGAGNGIENAAEISQIALHGIAIEVADGAGIRTATAIAEPATASILVTGAGTGIALRRADGSDASDDFTLGKGYTIRVDGNGDGIEARTSGRVDSAASVNVTGANGGAALRVGQAAASSNSGTLRSASTVAPVVDLIEDTNSIFRNTGTLEARDAAALAIRGSATNDRILLAGGSVRGEIASGAGADIFMWSGGSLDGGLRMGDDAGNLAILEGVDTSQVSHLLVGKGGDNTLYLNNTQLRGGSFLSDDPARGVNLGQGWNTINLFDGSGLHLSDGLRLGGSAVNIDASSTLYAGDSVHPLISSPTPLETTLNNAGTIDLRSADGTLGNRLDLDGNYVSQGGTIKLGSTLNEGGAPDRQFTDRLLIRGDVFTPGGASVLDVTPSAASVGALSDSNHNGMVDANEGISLVQVGGLSSANAFSLRGGYVAAGPYQYGLHAFQPGQSLAAQREVAGASQGNQYWDYRLGNIYVCASGDCGPGEQPGGPGEQPGGPGEQPGGPGEQPGGPGEEPGGPGGPGKPPVPSRPAVTPQVPAYISLPVALTAYDNAVLGNLQQRLGEIRDDKRAGGLGGESFVRVIGGNYHYHTDRSFNDYGYNFDEQMTALQVGLNVLDVDNQHSSLRAGVAYTHGRTHFQPQAVDGYSRGTFDSNSFGMYTTWQHVNGFYVDGVLVGQRHQGDIVTARSHNEAHIHANGWSGSLETGYPWRFGQGWTLEPQLQITRQHLQVRDFTDRDHASVSYDAYNQTIGRLGAMLSRHWQSDGGMLGMPYLRLNYLRGWGGAPSLNVGDDSLGLSRGFHGGSYGQVVELGAGGNLSWRSGWSLYGEADYQHRVSDAGLSGWGATVGVRLGF